MSRCQESFLTPIFFISPEICLLERPLPHKTGPKGRGRVDSVQEMGTVETVLGIRNGIQVHSSFHTDVKEMEYKDLLKNTFTQADHEGHEKLGAKYAYPQCVVCTHR
jgi:hypothetical protein